MRERTKSPIVKQLAKTAFPNWRGRKFYVEFSDSSQRLMSYWDEGSKDDYRLVNLKTGEVTHPPTSYPFGGENNPSYVPQAGIVLVQHSIFCGKDGGCTVSFHSADKEQFCNETQ